MNKDPYRNQFDIETGEIRRKSMKATIIIIVVNVVVITLTLLALWVAMHTKRVWIA